MQGALEAVHLAKRGEVFAELRGVVGVALGLKRPQDVGIGDLDFHLVAHPFRVVAHALQHLIGVSRKRNGARLARLGLLQVEAALAISESMGDGDDPLVRIEVAPAKGAYLGASHASREDYLHGDCHGGGLCAAGEVEHAASVLTREGVDL